MQSLPEGFEEYVPLQTANSEHKERAMNGPNSIADCEVCNITIRTSLSEHLYQDTFINKINFQIPMYLTTPELRTPHYSGHFNLA